MSAFHCTGDFNADFPFPKIDAVLNFPAMPEGFCELGDIVMGINSGVRGRVTGLIDGGIRIHPLMAGEFLEGEVLVSPSSAAEILKVSCVTENGLKPS